MSARSVIGFSGTPLGTIFIVSAAMPAAWCIRKTQAEGLHKLCKFFARRVNQRLRNRQPLHNC